MGSAPVTVIGAGLAGSEAAWQLATRGVPVRLIEMRPKVLGPAHRTDRLAELVCSNSMKSDDPHTAAGALKHELAALGSLVLACARSASVPAGAALAVDRERFADSVTASVSRHPCIDLVRERANALPRSGHTIVATGPLTDPALEPALSEVVGPGRLAFFDAAAPVVESASIDRGRVFAASRYGKGEGADYLNCPMDRPTYERFIDALTAAERVVLKDFESRDLFHACQPIEEIARRAPDAPRFGPMKPVGLTDPATGERPWAVVQLRAENREGTAYNLVGFQTNLTFPEQQRVFRMVPGLEAAEFTRYGVMHRNTFVDAPRVLAPDLSLLARPDVWLAGQLAGTEGYLEAAATGLLAALNVCARLTGGSPFVLPRDTLLGSLVSYATDPDTAPYQPMHVNFGLLPPLPSKMGKRDRYAAYAARAADALDAYVRTRSDLVPAPGATELCAP
ncbi:MAG: methylenetetrahydrofolate--tRNA-(uracil(54)-C(5))-methyltransferase (FADH(2)-oxidizing) TrmFO [Actinobacteria bacterium]|nr:MAG: methylenetetrahydrofolate--tRNA-(uracil(54)-C(5))-methyltransferase (FADH(2)-oxidizing) TrmFO [Actinomycetota bacterium]